MSQRNIIDAIKTIIKDKSLSLSTHPPKSLNRMNAMGEQLEDYIRDSFAGVLDESNSKKKSKIISEVFSYLGNQNNPPDLILKGSDAIEVKKLTSLAKTIALNSSYPKHRLYCDSPMLTNACRTCEENDWDSKDIIYTIGIVDKKEIRAIGFFYGIEFCDSPEVYERIRNSIKDGVESLPDISFSETKELGRVNKIDHLGLTSLRVRGMWQITNPFIYFWDHYQVDLAKKFSLVAMISEDKLLELDNFNELIELSKEVNELVIRDVEIPNPLNPAKLKSVKLITYHIDT